MRTFTRAFVVTGSCILLSLVPMGQLRAQALEPRLLSPAPVGMNFVVVGYGYSAGNVVLDLALPLEDTKARVHSLTATYVRSINVFGMSGRIVAALPLANSTWNTMFGGRDTSTTRTGLGDPVIGIGVGFLGAPALSAAEMATYRARTLVGVTFRVSVPLGQFDETRFFNISTNRWSVMPGLALAQYIGRFVFEGQLRAWFFTRNNDFFNGITIAQDPLFGFQLHAEYTFRRGFWGAVSFGQRFGGATTVDGVEEDNKQTNNRFGVTLAVPVSKAWSLKGAFSSAVTTRFGADFETLVFALQYRWGGGFKG